MKPAANVIRIVLAVWVGIGTFLGTMVAGCDDVGGVPTWERCTTWLGTPALIDWPDGTLDLVIPLLLGSLVGGGVWWLLARRDRGEPSS
jgi:hypothetical protein